MPALFREDKDVKEVEMVDIELGETKEGEKEELLDKVRARYLVCGSCFLANIRRDIFLILLSEYFR